MIENLLNVYVAFWYLLLLFEIEVWTILFKYLNFIVIRTYKL